MSVFDSLEATWDVVKSEKYREQAIRVLNSFWTEKRVRACSPLLRLRLTWACCWDPGRASNASRAELVCVRCPMQLTPLPRV